MAFNYAQTTTFSVPFVGNIGRIVPVRTSFYGTSQLIDYYHSRDGQRRWTHRFYFHSSRVVFIRFSGNVWNDRCRDVEENRWRIGRTVCAGLWTGNFLGSNPVKWKPFRVTVHNGCSRVQPVVHEKIFDRQIRTLFAIRFLGVGTRCKIVMYDGY